MPAHSRPKDGVATLAYVAGIHALLCGKGRRGWPGQVRPWRTLVRASGEIASRSLSSGRPKAGPVGGRWRPGEQSAHQWTEPL